jgi:hypothetical protein
MLRKQVALKGWAADWATVDANGIDSVLDECTCWHAEQTTFA